jgi:hypothetical protein
MMDLIWVIDFLRDCLVWMIDVVREGRVWLIDFLRDGSSSGDLFV